MLKTCHNLEIEINIPNESLPLKYVIKLTNINKFILLEIKFNIIIINTYFLINFILIILNFYIINKKKK